MATTSLTRLRELLARATAGSSYFNSTSTGAGASDGTTVVDSVLPGFDSGPLAAGYVLATSGTNDGEQRPIASISTSTLTVSAAFGAQVVTSVTYEIFPYNPSIYTDAIQQALRAVYPNLYLRALDETLIVDNLLSNSSFETFSVTFTNWTNIGTPTLSQSTTRRMHLSNAAVIAATGATEGIEQNILDVPDVVSRVGKVLHVRGFMRASVTDAVRLRVTYNGTDFDDSSFHAGDDDWEHVVLDSTIDANASEMTISLEATSGNTGYFDLVVAWIDPITLYTMPTAFYPDGPHLLRQQADAQKPEGLYLPFGPENHPVSGRVLRLEGQNRLTVPTTESGTTEIDEAQGEIIVALAARNLYRSLKEADPGQRASHTQNELGWGQEYLGLIDSRKGLRMARMSASARDFWKIDSDTRRLVLYR